MHPDDAVREVRKMVDSQELTREEGRAFIGNPIEAVKLVKMVQIQTTVDKLSRAVFGEEELEQPSILSRLKTMELEFFKWKWAVFGGTAVSGGVFAVLGLLIGVWLKIH